MRPTAAQKQDIGALRALVQRKVDVNAAQPDGTTALHWAVVWNNEDAVNLLLRAGADAKARNRYGATPLSEAVTAGSAAMVEALLKAGADPKTLTTEEGETVLMTAARAGNADVVRMLLDRGADVNAREKYKGQTALMWAAAERHPAVVKLLLDRGADWKVRSVDRETKVPRLSAASSISPIARGGFTALSFAAREGDIESARVMLDGGVDINYGDVDNTSALVVSIMNKQYSFAKFLIDRGADVNLVGGYGRTALYAIVDIRNEDYSALPARKTEDPLPTLDIVKALLARGANVNLALTANLPGRSGMDSGDTTLTAGTTPLMRAARAGDTAVIRLLLERGADPTADDEGRKYRPDVCRRRRLSRQEYARQRARRAGGGEDIRRCRPRPAPGEHPRRDRAARRRGPRRRHHRAVSRRSWRRAERQDQTGIHPSRRRDGQSQP